MKKSRFLILAIIMLLFVVPVFAKAESINDFDETKAVLVGQTKKYLKTVNEYSNVREDLDGNIISADLLSSKTYELTKEEWDRVDPNDNIITRSSTTIETTYKLMTTSLYYNNGFYRYQNQLNWLNFPVVRSYDIIAIGHYNNITPKSTPTFYLEYVTTGGNHYTSNSCTQQSFSAGKSATFTLPTQNLQSMDAVYYFDAKKLNPSSTIYSQAAYGDYAHGISTSLTYNEAVNHVVNGSLGIVHGSSVFNKFDTISEAMVLWYGTW